jgi:hypothetical protein
MANWKVRINVADLWRKYEDDEDFDSFKEALLEKLDDEDLYAEITEKIDEEAAYQFSVLVDDLKPCSDVEEFDYAWQNLYDWADYNKVWIATF